MIILKNQSTDVDSNLKRLLRIHLNRNVLKEYEECMMNGRYFSAANIAKTFELKEKERNAALLAYKLHMNQENYEHYKSAAQIAMEFGLGDDKVKSAALKAYIICLEKESYLVAAQIAMEFGLGDDRVKRAALKEYEILFADNNSFAAQIAKDFELGDDKVRRAALKGYKRCLIQKDYESAAAISKEFGLGEDKEKVAAFKAYKIYFTKKDYTYAARIARDFKLKDEEKCAAIKACEEFLKNNRYLDAAQIAKYHSLGTEIIEGTQKLFHLLTR